MPAITAVQRPEEVTTSWTIEVEAPPPGQRAYARLFGSFEEGRTIDQVLAEYGRVGEKCFAALRGQFALFLWDQPREAVWVVRDPMGSHPLFYAQVGQRFLFAASQASLLRHPSVRPGLNRLAMADFFRDSWPTLDETFHQHTRRVPPGHALRISSKGVGCERYWLRRDEPVRWLADDEAGVFDALFARAVERCLGTGRTGIFLSGGLDSVAVAAKTADIVATSKLASVHAMSLVFPEETADESEIQRAVAGQLGFSQTLAPLLSTVDHPEGVLGASLEYSARLDSPVLNVWLPSYLRLAEQGRALGCDTILTGTGGDEWLGLTPLLGADLMRSGQLGAWLRLAALRWRSSYHGRSLRAFWNYAWHFSARPLLRRRAASALRYLAPESLAQHRRRRVWNQLPDWLLPDPALRKQLAERGERFDALQDGRGDDSFYLEELRVSLEHTLASHEAEEWFHAYAPLDVRVRHPFYDADLVEFLVRMAPEQLLKPGRSKGLVRGALEERFPQLGFQKQLKVEATGYFGFAMQQYGPALWKRFGSFPALSALGLVDPRKVPPPGGNGYRRQFYSWSLVNMEAWLQPRV